MTAISKLLRSTAFRLSLIYLAVFALFAGSLLAYIAWNTRVIFTNQLVDTIEAEVQGLAEQYRLGGVTRLAQVIQLRTRSPTNTLYLVTDFQGNQLVGNVADVPQGTLDESGLLRITYEPLEGARNGPHEALVRVFALSGGYRLLVGRDVEDRGRLMDIVRRASVLSIGLMILLGVGGGYYVSHKILARIDSVSETSRTIMTGNLAQRVPLAGSGDEFDRLAGSLNAMLDRIEQLMRGLKEVSDNIAHDLKTPLTRLRGRTEAALRQGDPAGYRDALETTLEESEQLIATFNALLMIARTEAGATGVHLAEVDLVPLVRDVAELYEPVAEEAGLALEVALPERAPVTGNRELIGQAVANLVDNAVKYGVPPAGGGAADDHRHHRPRRRHLGDRRRRPGDGHPGGGARARDRALHAARGEPQPAGRGARPLPRRRRGAPARRKPALRGQRAGPQGRPCLAEPFQRNGGMTNKATNPLASQICERPLPSDPEAAEAHLSDLLQAEGCGELRTMVEGDEALRAFLLGVLDHSSWLRGRFAADPRLVQATLAADPSARLDALCEGLSGELREAEDQPAAMRLLRRFKTEAAVLIALCDLGGVWPVDEVTAAMTRIADLAVARSVDFLLSAQAARGKIDPPDPERPSVGCGLVVLAMGKQGAGELNFSSDIDLIVFYDAERAPLEDKLEAQKFFVRLTKDLVKLLGEYTEDGYVFRVDLRLRPDPGATAVAISLDAALQYYESLGQNWERAALVKARPCAGDIEAGETFLKEISPFVWRKYMDFAALADVHAMKRQIHAAKGHEKIAVAGHNLKLGRGGIREIEFFAQTQQLVAGGRHHELRVRQTLEALDRLAEGGWIQDSERDELKEAYRFLRRLEHRLQMVADEQTHTLPEGEEQLERFARFAGFEDADALSEALLQRLRTVQTHYAALFEHAPTLSSETGNLVFTGGEDDPDTLETLSRMGFQSPRAVTEAVRSWHFGRISSTRSARARETLTEITPALLEALSRSANPDAAFTALDRFLNNLPAGVQLFSLLRSNPEMLSLLATILGTAPRLADLLGRRPRIFASVLEPDFFDELPTRETLEEYLDGILRDALSYEDALDRARIFGQEQGFLIGVRVLSDTVSAAEAGDAFTRLADVLVARLHDMALAELARRHGRVPGGASAVLALGKLGSREMTATSDLDLILLYELEDGASESDGDRPLAPSQYYARLTQRLVAALSAPTAEGQLYEVDMRLRPSGRSGPVATRVASFADYQENEAWTWEHMALTRARVVAGPPELEEQIDGIVRAVLTRTRDPDALRRDIAEMRGRIEKEKGSESPWDLKAVAGGLIDLEFIAQYLQLAHAAEHPEILLKETVSVLAAARDAGLLEAGDAQALLAAGRLYQGLTQILRLCVGPSFDPASVPRGLTKLLLRQSDLPDLQRLELELRDMQAGVRAIFERLIGEVVPVG